MAQAYYVETPDGQKVPFQVPANATPEQVQALASRALKAKLPNTTYRRPVLSAEAQGSLSAPSGIRNRLETTAYDALAGLGVDPRGAARWSDKITGALDVLPGIGDAIQLGEAKEAWQGGRYLEATGKTALGALGLIPGVGDALALGGKALAAKASPALAMFGGRLAKTADLGALAEARRLEAADVQPDLIWQRTGWGRGADNQMRFEIPDQGLAFNKEDIPNVNMIDLAQMANDYSKKKYGKLVSELEPFSDAYNDAIRYWGNLKGQDPMARVGDVVSHPELFKAYPDLENAKLGSLSGVPAVKGSWDPRKGILRLNPVGSGPAGTRSTLAHELQHGVQTIERFAPGSSVKAMQGQLKTQLKQTDQLIAHYKRELERETDPKLIASLQEALGQLEHHRTWVARPRAKLDPFAAYQSSAGEVEARNVQYRLEYPEELRRAMPPWTTQRFVEGGAPEYDQQILSDPDLRWIDDFRRK
jgi:hypothetical protein